MNKRCKGLHNDGSFTVEMSVIMVIYLMIILMSFQMFFLLAKNVNIYCDGVNQAISIEKEVENIRRWQFVRGAL